MRQNLSQSALSCFCLVQNYFFSPQLLCFGFSMRRMLITLMFSLVVKSRTFSSFSYSEDEQVCRSWDRAQPDRQPKLGNGNIPYHRRHAQFMNGGWLGGRKLSALLVLLSLNPFLAGNLNFFQAANRLSGSEKKSCCIYFFFAYTLLSLWLSLLVVVVVSVLVFPLWSY